MSTRTLVAENGLEKRRPNVFERLSKQQTNKVNSQRNSKVLNQEPRKTLQSGPHTVKRRSPPTNSARSHPQKKGSKSQAEPKESLSSSCDSYDEKALMESVPETFGKDLLEESEKDAERGTQNIMSPRKERTEDSQNNHRNRDAFSPSSLSTQKLSRRSPGRNQNDVSEFKSEVCNGPVPPPKNNVYRKSKSLTEKQNSDDASYNKISRRKSSLTNSFREKDLVQTSAKLMTSNRRPKLKKENLVTGVGANARSADGITNSFDTSPRAVKRSPPMLNGNLPSDNGNTHTLDVTPPLLNGNHQLLKGNHPTVNGNSTHTLKGNLPVANNNPPLLNGNSPQLNGSHPPLNENGNPNGNPAPLTANLPKLNGVILKPKSKGRDPPLDADKDVCDNDDEDDEFYRVKVQTRLVTYENSTLVIRNTSKQKEGSPLSSDSEAVGETSPSLHESLSSCSLLSSLSGPEEPSVSREASGEDPSDEGDQTALRGVRSRIGQLVTKGRSLWSDVRSSGYVPDVKASFSKIHGATRRSLRSIAFPPTTNSPPSDSHQSPYPPSIHEDNKARKLELDSGFSSLSSTMSSEAKSRPKSESLSESSELAAAAEVQTDTEPGSSEGPGPPRSEPDSLKQDSIDEGEDCDRERDYGKFFRSCPCQEGVEEDRSADGAPSRPPQDPNRECTCQQESEFPLEIKELLDADYARMWWTITGNFGNILPIDWSKTYTRQKYLPVLNLNEAKKCAMEGNSSESVTPSPREDEDEEVAQDLDLHQLILAGMHQENEPVKSAEEVIKEIDDIMQEASSSEDEGIDASSSSSSKESSKSDLQQLPPPLYHDKLKDLSVPELNETLMELEVVIRRYSETLIAQLAHRDELEYEKELKNTFISLLLQVQNKRRNLTVEKKRVKKPLGPNGIDPKYLTTVIPYDVGHGPPSNETIQILIKILTAINDDTPTVPTLLTDYILKVLCPS